MSASLPLLTLPPSSPSSIIEYFGRVSEFCPSPSQQEEKKASEIIFFVNKNYGAYHLETSQWCLETSPGTLLCHPHPHLCPSLLMISDLLHWFRLSEQMLTTSPNGEWREVNDFLVQRIPLLIKYYNFNQRCEVPVSVPVSVPPDEDDSPGVPPNAYDLSIYLSFFSFIPGFICLFFGGNQSTGYVGPIYFQTTGTLIETNYVDDDSNDSDTVDQNKLELIYGYDGYASPMKNNDGVDHTIPLV
jgi:hypothetical protein